MAAQMRHTAPVIAGSTTELLTTGMPYDQNIACFFTNGQADLIGAAQNTFNLYNAMSGQSRSLNTSAMRADDTDRFSLPYTFRVSSLSASISTRVGAVL